MSIRGWLLLACAAFGAVYLLGEFFSSPILPSAELLAWVALAAYLLVAGRDAPVRVRLALAAGVVTLGVLVAASLRSTVDGAGSAFIALSPARRESELDVAAEAVRESLPALTAYACLALAVIFLPRRNAKTPQRRDRTGVVLTVVGVAAAVTYMILELSGRVGLASIFAAVPPALVAVFAFATAGRVGRWLPAAGLAALGVAALILLSDVLDRVNVPQALEANVFLQPGLRYSGADVPASSFAVTMAGRTAVLESALGPILQLAGAAAIAVACLRRADPPEAPGPAPDA